MARRGRSSASIWDKPRSQTDAAYARRREEFFRALREVEDRRLFHPEKPLVPAATLESRTARRIVERAVGRLPKSFGASYFSSRLGFAIPDEVAICIRRKQRKEVLHAKRKVGRGSGGGKHHWNWFSSVFCR